MTATRKILAVTDLGAAGAEAVRAGAARALAVGATLAVVHTMPPLDMVRPNFAERVADDALRIATLPQQVRRALDRQLAACAPDGPGAEVFLETGGAAEIALTVAEHRDGDALRKDDLSSLVGHRDAALLKGPFHHPDHRRPHFQPAVRGR